MYILCRNQTENIYQLYVISVLICVCWWWPNVCVCVCLCVCVCDLLIFLPNVGESRIKQSSSMGEKIMNISTNFCGFEGFSCKVMILLCRFCILLRYYFVKLLTHVKWYGYICIYYICILYYIIYIADSNPASKLRLIRNTMIFVESNWIIFYRKIQFVLGFSTVR